MVLCAAITCYKLLATCYKLLVADVTPTNLGVGGHMKVLDTSKHAKEATWHTRIDPWSTGYKCMGKIGRCYNYVVVTARLKDTLYVAQPSSLGLNIFCLENNTRHDPSVLHV